MGLVWYFSHKLNIRNDHDKSVLSCVKTWAFISEDFYDLSGESVKLSICIATLNRAKYIGQTLDSIVPQLTAESEVVIVDGASIDNTSEVVNTYSAQHKNIRYFRLNKKGGVDADYCKTIEFARGEYCWLMSDDDLMDATALSKVFQALDTAPDLLLINSQIKSIDFQVILEERRLKIYNDLEFGSEEFEHFFRTTANYLSFIGAVIIKRSIWLEREKEKYFGSCFIHMGVIFQKPFSGTIKVLSNPLIFIRNGNAQWTNRSFHIWMFKWPKLIWSFLSFSDEVKLQIVHKKPWTMFKKLILLRALGRYTWSEFKFLIASERFSIIGFVKAFVIVLVPICVLNTLAKFFYIYVRKDLVTAADLSLAKSPNLN